MAAQTFTVSGEGIATITNGWTGISKIYCKVTTIGGPVHVKSNTNPKRLQHAGWFGIAANSSPKAYVSWFMFMEFEWVSHPFSPLEYGDRIIYHFEPGSSGSIEINY